MDILLKEIGKSNLSSSYMTRGLQVRIFKKIEKATQMTIKNK